MFSAAAVQRAHEYFESANIFRTWANHAGSALAAAGAATTLVAMECDFVSLLAKMEWQTGMVKKTLTTEWGELVDDKTRSLRACCVPDPVLKNKDVLVCKAMQKEILENPQRKHIPKLVNELQGLWLVAKKARFALWKTTKQKTKTENETTREKKKRQTERGSK